MSGVLVIAGWAVQSNINTCGISGVYPGVSRIRVDFGVRSPFMPKHRGHPKLVFFKAPYIGLAAASGYRIPNVEIVEELVRQEGDVVEYGALREAVCERMGLKEFQFLQITGQLQNAIRTEKGFSARRLLRCNLPGIRLTGRIRDSRNWPESASYLQTLFMQRSGFRAGSWVSTVQGCCIQSSYDSPAS